MKKRRSLSDLTDPSLVCLEEIRQRYSVLTIDNVLEEARNESSPIHADFEWDDSVAAEKYRREQAGTLIRRYEIVVTQSESAGRVNRYTYVPSERAYRPVNEVVQNDALSREVLSQMRSELQAFLFRYNSLAALVPGAKRLMVLVESALTEVARDESPERERVAV